MGSFESFVLLRQGTYGQISIKPFKISFLILEFYIIFDIKHNSPTE